MYYVIFTILEILSIIYIHCPWRLPPSPSLQIFSDMQNPEQVLVLTINVKEPPSRAQRFMQNNQINLPLISDSQGEWAQKFGVKVYPTTLLLDTQGQIKWRVMGEVDWTSAEPQAWVNSLR